MRGGRAMTGWRTWWWLGFAPVAAGAAACWHLYATEPYLACFGLGACTVAVVVWCLVRDEIEWREYEAIRPLLEEIRRTSADPARIQIMADLRRRLALDEIRSRDTVAQIEALRERLSPISTDIGKKRG